MKYILLMITCLFNLFLGASEWNSNAEKCELPIAPQNSAVVTFKSITAFELLRRSNNSRYGNFRTTPPMASPFEVETSLKILTESNNAIRGTPSFRNPLEIEKTPLDDIDYLKNKMAAFPKSKSDCYYKIAQRYGKLDKFDKVIKYLLLAIKYNSDPKIKLEIAIALNRFIICLEKNVEISLANNDYQTAIKYLSVLINQSADIETKNTSTEILVELTNELLDSIQEKVNTDIDCMNMITILNMLQTLPIFDEKLQDNIQFNLNELIECLYTATTKVYFDFDTKAIKKDINLIDIELLKRASECLDFLLKQNLEEQILDILKRHNIYLEKIIKKREISNLSLLSQEEETELLDIANNEVALTASDNINSRLNICSTQTPLEDNSALQTGRLSIPSSQVPARSCNSTPSSQLNSSRLNNSNRINSNSDLTNMDEINININQTLNMPKAFSLPNMVDIEPSHNSQIYNLVEPNHNEYKENNDSPEPSIVSLKVYQAEIEKELKIQEAANKKKSKHTSCCSIQ